MINITGTKFSCGVTAYPFAPMGRWGLAQVDVSLTVTLSGGGFEHRLDVDLAAQTVCVAMDCSGLPVQLIWSREKGMPHDFFRPMHASALRTFIAASDQICGLGIRSAGDEI